MTPDRIREIFKSLEIGDGAAFFTHVADDVDWTVMGTHPLAGHYHNKTDYASTFVKLRKVLPQGAQLHVEHVLVKDNEVVVELRSLATAINGLRFDNRYCMVLTFDGDHRARSFLRRLGVGGASVQGKSNRMSRLGLRAGEVASAYPPHEPPPI
jgi:uncharacterized protein